MRILITNDDGINAPGIDVLEKVASDLTKDVWVVAPEIDNSGASHSLTLAEPLRMRELGKRHYAVKGTPLADQVERGEVVLMEQADYIATLVDFLELLPPTTVVERISGDAPPDYFIGPAWCLDKPAVKKALDEELSRRAAWQGKRFVASDE